MLRRIAAAVSAAWTGAREAWTEYRESTYRFGVDGIDTTGPHADFLFRNIRGSIADRDVPPYLIDRILRTAWHAYIRNPLAKRGVDTTRDFVVGEGMKLKASDPWLQRELERHWFDPSNNWEVRLEMRVLELGLYGEWCQLAVVNEHNGDVRWINIDPLMIERIIPDERNPDLPKWVILRDGVPGLHVGSVGGRVDGMRKKLRVIYRDDNVQSETFGRLIGDVIFVGINRTGYATRGLSDLTSVLDWIEMHEDFLLAVQEAARSKIAHLWDITIKGATRKVLQQFMRSFGESPGSGTVRAHSDKTEIKNIAPQLMTSELEAHSRMIKRHIAVGFGIPEHWLGEGADGSSDGIIDASTPATKRLRGRARVVREIVRMHLDFAMDQRRIAGQLPIDVDPTYKLITPPLAVIDVQRISASVMTTTEAMIMASSKGDKGEAPLLSRREAREVVLFAISQFGVDAEALDRSAESPPSNEARDVADPDTFDPAEARGAAERQRAQRDQLTQRQLVPDGAAATPAMPGVSVMTLGGAS